MNTELENQIKNFKEQFCPYGYLDIEMAVKEAINAGKDGNWAFEQIEDVADQTESKISQLDPCYVIMDAILQEARNEIDNLIGFDILNDADFGVYGNYCASSWGNNDEDKELLSEKLNTNEVDIDNLSEATKYWLSENEIEL